MEKFIPYEKLSKKAKKQLNAKKRGSWGCVSPVTRCEQDKRAYRRHDKHRRQAEYTDT